MSALSDGVHAKCWLDGPFDVALRSSGHVALNLSTAKPFVAAAVAVGEAFRRPVFVTAPGPPLTTGHDSLIER